MVWWPLIIIALLLTGTTLVDLIADKPRKVSNKFRGQLVVAFVGAASSGKSSGVRAVFGKTPDSIHPIPGTTKEVSTWVLRDGLSVADTPGLQDTDEALVKEAKEFYDNVDIFVYVINSNGGINRKVKCDLEIVKKIDRPLLVVLNKIDTIKKRQRKRFAQNQLRASGVTKDAFFQVAFDPLPQISKTPMNINLIQKWITKTVTEKGDGLLKLKREAESA